MVLPEQGKVVAIPLTAVVRASYGDSIFLVEDRKAEPGAAKTPDGKPRKIARQQFVKRRRHVAGDFVARPRGREGEPGEVVTAGAFKLRNSAGVVVDNTSQAHARALSPSPNRKAAPDNR